MSTNNALKIFEDALKKHHTNLLESLEGLIRTLPTNNQDGNIVYAKRALDESNYLSNMLHDNNKAEWAFQLDRGLSNFIQNPNKFAPDLNINLMSLIPQIKNHTWIHLLEETDPFDIDSIYRKYRDESNLPALFDKIIELLGNISESPEIDSRSLLQALEKLISTLKKNKNGSYLSIQSAWQFLKLFLQNYIIGELEKIPALGTLLVALIETTNELHDEFIQVSETVQNKAKKEFEEEIKSLPRGSSLHIEYTQDAKLPMPPSLSHLLDIKS